MKNSKARRSSKGWTTRRFDSKALHLAQTAYLDIGTDVSLNLLAKTLRGEFLSVVDAKVDPLHYTCAESFRNDYLAVSLMSKFPCWELGIDREKVALSRFVESELSCAAAAKRLDTHYVNGLYSRITPESIIMMAREKIMRVLGPFSWDLAEPYFGFGPGATFARSRREGDAYYKFGSKPDVTYGCATLAYTALHRVPLWYNHVVSLTGETSDSFEQRDLVSKIDLLFTRVKGNRIHFVPKDAKKDRTIAIEPTMNGFIQHGIGKLLRSRLRRVGVNLDDQTPNQRMALSGSIDGSLATLDLSAASDSVSMRLVETLLPDDWVEAIRLTRSPFGTLPDGSEVRYQKVSSMGNGYTFELESLIFWAIAKSCMSLLNLSDRRLCVYGDDIVIPTGAAATLVWMLDFVGFKTNIDKSFVSGPFRESCGKHYFRGVDVTPLYVREDIHTPQRLLWFCNQVRRWSRLSYGLDPLMRPTYEYGVSLLPSSLRKPSIPDGLGDYALFGDFDEALPRRASQGHEGWTCWVFLPFFRTVEKGDTPFLLRQLFSLDQSKGFETSLLEFLREASNGRYKSRYRLTAKPFRVTSRDRLPSWRRVSVPVAKWPSYGPWLGS